MLAVLRSVELAFPSVFPRPAPSHLRIDVLHSDIVYLVARQLQVLDLLSLACVCKRLNQLISADHLWAPLFETEFPWARQRAQHGSWKEVYVTWFRAVIKTWRRSGLQAWPSHYSSVPRYGNRDVSPVRACLFGPVGTGKSSLMTRISRNEFSATYIPTIGVDFTIFVNQSQKVQLWDLSGDQRFRVIVQNYYSSTRVGIFVYDDNTTREVASEWLNSWFSVLASARPLIFVRTRCDVPNASPQLDKDSLIDIASRHSVAFPISFVDVSSATGAGIDKLTSTIVSSAAAENPVTPKYIVPEHEVRARMPLLDAPWYKRVAYWY